MIDYYKAIDTETGQEVTYLREVSNRISPEMSAQDCFVALSFLREELEELWTNGTLDKEGERLRSELYTIRSIFFSDHEKLQYDRKLRQAQRKALEVEKVTTTDASNLSAKKEIPFEPVAVTQTKESPLCGLRFCDSTKLDSLLQYQCHRSYYRSHSNCGFDVTYVLGDINGNQSINI